MISLDKFSLTFLNLMDEFIIDIYHLEDEVLMVLNSFVELLCDIAEFNSWAGVVHLMAVFATLAEKC